MDRSTAETRWSRVTAVWAASYTPALAVRRGEVVTLGRMDPDNPGWRWAENGAGLGGWVPVALIVDDHLSQDFDSTELTVSEGERVEVLETRAGWHLCRSEPGALGWLPAKVLG